MTGKYKNGTQKVNFTLPKEFVNALADDISAHLRVTKNIAARADGQEQSQSLFFGSSLRA